MIQSPFPKNGRSPDWQGMLTDMEQSVASALVDAKVRERALRTDPLLSERRKSGISAAIEDAPVQAHLDALKACIHRAEASVDEVDKMLDEGKASILGWQTEARVLRQKLEAWLGHSVK